MRFFAVSDLHVHGPDDPLYASLLKLIRERTQRGDTLVLAGDIFDLFVGNKEIFLNRYSEFMQALRDAALRGVELHYIEGNHDFHIRKAFIEVPGILIHPHHVTLQLKDRKFFVAHGDTVDRTDYGYLALRTFFRSPVMKALVAVTPGKWLDSFGKRSSHESRHRNQKKMAPGGAQFLDRIEGLRKAYRNYAAEKLTEGFDFVVMGHCHDLDEMKFTIDGRIGQYMNIGYPRAHGSFVSWSEGDACIQREKLPEP